MSLTLLAPLAAAAGVYGIVSMVAEQISEDANAVANVKKQEAQKKGAKKKSAGKQKLEAPRDSGDVPSPETCDCCSCGFCNEAYSGLRKLGQGGFGETFYARSEEEGEEVVLKFIWCRNVSDANDGLAECRSMVRVSHPNVVRPRNFFLHKNKNSGSGIFVVIVMDFCDGGDMYDHVKALKKRGQTLPEHEFLKYMSQLCLAVQYIHEQKLIHRDLKPENVLLSRDGSCTTAYLADFGLSRFIDARDLQNARGKRGALRRTTQRQTGNRDAEIRLPMSYVGTEAFMAPEMAANKDYNSAVDVWGLACIFAYMASGEEINARKKGQTWKSWRENVLSKIPQDYGCRNALTQLLRGMLEPKVGSRTSIQKVCDSALVAASAQRPHKRVHMRSLPGRLRRLAPSSEPIMKYSKRSLSGPLTMRPKNLAGASRLQRGLRKRLREVEPERPVAQRGRRKRARRNVAKSP